MPNYDYRCPECGYEEEINHSMFETDTNFLCQTCEDPTTLKKVLNPTPAHFKGTGFASNNNPNRDPLGISS